MERGPSEEKWYESELSDPVFEGMVKELGTFDEALQSISDQIEAFMAGARQLAEGLQALSDGISADLARTEDRTITADGYRLRQATHQVTHVDAPHSSIAKLQRNMDFNVVKPLESHIANNEKLKTECEKRRRRLAELKSAVKQMEVCTKRNLSETDPRFLMAQQEYNTSKNEFEEVDRNVFEWLYSLELHREDVFDSCLQTLKHLQYEFFATSAHAICGVLPARMAFRPMAEMAPHCLEAQVELETQETHGWDALADGPAGGSGFSTRLVERLARDGKDEEPQLPVDMLSLSSLLSQGFEEGPARRALRLHRNDTQAALDWLVRGGGSAAGSGPQADDGVRPATTGELLQRRRELLQRQKERLRANRETSGTGPSPVGLGASAVFS